MLITYALLFLVTLIEAERCKRHNVDVTEDFGKSVLFGNVNRDGSISNAFVPYALSQKNLDPPEEPPLDVSFLIFVQILERSHRSRKFANTE